jgi:hypothetical protein
MRCCRPRVPAGCWPTQQRRRPTMTPCPDCAAGWETQRSSRPGSRAPPWDASVPWSTPYRTDDQVPWPAPRLRRGRQTTMYAFLKRSRQRRQPGPGSGAARGARTRLRNTVPGPDHSGRLAVQALLAGGRAERPHISPDGLPGRRKLQPRLGGPGGSWLLQLRPVRLSSGRRSIRPQRCRSPARPSSPRALGFSQAFFRRAGGLDPRVLVVSRRSAVFPRQGAIPRRLAYGEQNVTSG